MFSMFCSVSPWASPPAPVPLRRSTVTARGRAGIARRVDAVAAVQRVGPGAALEQVVARTAGEDVGPGVAGERVAEGVPLTFSMLLKVSPWAAPEPVPVARLTWTAMTCTP